MPKQRRSGHTLIGLLGVIATVAVLSTVLLCRLCQGPMLLTTIQRQEAWVETPIHLAACPPRAASSPHPRKETVLPRLPGVPLRGATPPA